MIELMVGEQACDLGMHRIPHAIRLGVMCQAQAHAQAQRRGLQDLELLDAWDVINRGAEQQRRNRNPFTMIRRKDKHISGATLHADRRQRVPARARIGALQDAVAEVVAQDRLDAVGEVAHEDRVRGLARRHGPVVRVDRLEHDPVGVDVQPVLGDDHDVAAVEVDVDVRDADAVDEQRALTADELDGVAGEGLQVCDQTTLGLVHQLVDLMVGALAAGADALPDRAEPLVARRLHLGREDDHLLRRLRRGQDLLERDGG